MLCTAWQSEDVGGTRGYCRVLENLFLSIGDSEIASERRVESHLRPGPTPNTVRSADGKVLTVPEG